MGSETTRVLLSKSTEVQHSLIHRDTSLCLDFRGFRASVDVSVTMHSNIACIFDRASCGAVWLFNGTQAQLLHCFFVPENQQVIV